ncbi:hypothetical protein JTB14_030802 [Gonioctena quinquepunctata]|nr:hypothetical protein JTB14_030802 [Gonioctena quinquepunctata]
MSLDRSKTTDRQADPFPHLLHQKHRPVVALFVWKTDCDRQEAALARLVHATRYFTVPCETLHPHYNCRLSADVLIPRTFTRSHAVRNRRRVFLAGLPCFPLCALPGFLVLSLMRCCKNL